jgi:hypothetical protein
MATTADSSTLAVLSRLRALELQVGLLDIVDHNHANNISNDDAVVAPSSSSSPQTSLSCKNKKDAVARLEALEHLASNFWTTNNPSSTASSTTASTSSTSVANNNNNNNNNVLTMGLAWKETWLESDRLFAELDPGTALTHQQQPNAPMAPILYRRQQVLCSADLLRQNMRLVSHILNLLLIGQGGRGSGSSAHSSLPNTANTTASSSTIKSSSTRAASAVGGTAGTSNSQQQNQQQQQQQLSLITEEQVVQAPILLCNTEIDPERLTKVETAALELQRRVKHVAARLDRLLTSYHSVVTIFSEHVVFLEEQVRQLEKQKKGAV